MKGLINVLVTGSGSFCGVNIIHSLRHAGGYRIIATDIYPLSAGLFLADRGYVIPKEGPDGRFVEALLQICEKESVQLLIPGFDSELPYIAASRDKFHDLGTKVIVGEPHFIEIANDKLKTQRFLEKEGFPFLRTYELGEQDRALNELNFPIVVKLRGGWGARGFHVVDSEEGLSRALQEVEDMGEIPIIQEYIPDSEGEYTTSVMIASDYEVLGSIVLKRELAKGSSRRIFVDSYPSIRQQVEAIAKSIHTTGPVNIQCRLRDGQVHVLEFNARFSTTNVVRATCGFNEVDILAHNLIFGEKWYIKEYKSAVVVMYQDYVYADPDAYQELELKGSADHIGQLHNAFIRDKVG